MTQKSPHWQKKRSRFLRVAPRRTTEVLEAMRILGNCGNTNAYAYEDDEVEKIFDAIDAEVRVLRSAFRKFRIEEFSLTGGE